MGILPMNACPHCQREMFLARAGRTNHPVTLYCGRCDHFAEGPCDCTMCYYSKEHRKQRDELLPEEERCLREDREMYLECLNGKPLKDRETAQEIRDGLIIYYNVYLRIRGGE